MKGVTVENVEANFGSYLGKCKSEGPIVITRAGKPIAVLVAPFDKDDLERLLLSHSPRFRAIIAKSRKSLEAGKGIPHDEFWKGVKYSARQGHAKRPRQTNKSLAETRYRPSLSRMTQPEHDDYAHELLSTLATDDRAAESLAFRPDPTKSRNAARAMTAILCQRLSAAGRSPVAKRNTTFDWKGGVFNCRNIADRSYFWSNVRRSVADALHESARGAPVAYLLAFSDPADTMLRVWALPEPILYEALDRLKLKEDGRSYTLQLRKEGQRIDRYAESPDLSVYYGEFPLLSRELQILNESRAVDASAKRKEDLATVGRELTKAGAFDPPSGADARKRVLASIVRRMGQPAFRRKLLKAYNGRCAITSCLVKDVLDAAHIAPYNGPETNQPRNGLLLRTDIHTLFDLKLIAVDVTTMCVIVDSSLAGTSYEEYHGKPIGLPGDPACQPNCDALERHRRESGL